MTAETAPSVQLTGVQVGAGEGGLQHMAAESE